MTRDLSVGREVRILGPKDLRGLTGTIIRRERVLFRHGWVVEVDQGPDGLRVYNLGSRQLEPLDEDQT